MKPGDLRQFKDGLRTAPRGAGHRGERCSGRPFMVIEIGGAQKSPWVSFLVGSHLEEKWGYEWVEKNSEPVDETR